MLEKKKLGANAGPVFFFLELFSPSAPPRQTQIFFAQEEEKFPSSRVRGFFWRKKISHHLAQS
jgi:hypothetical protein